MVKMLRGTMGGYVLNILFLALNIKRFCIWVTFSFFPKNSRDTFIYEKNCLDYPPLLYISLLETAPRVLYILIKLQAILMVCAVKLHKGTKGKQLEKSLMGRRANETFQQSSLVSVSIIRPPFPL